MKISNLVTHVLLSINIQRITRVEKAKKLDVMNMILLDSLGVTTFPENFYEVIESLPIVKQAIIAKIKEKFPEEFESFKC